MAYTDHEVEIEGVSFHLRLNGDEVVFLIPNLFEPEKYFRKLLKQKRAQKKARRGN